MPDRSSTMQHAATMTNLRAAVTSLPMMLMTFVMLSGGKLVRDPVHLFALVATFCFLNTLFFLMVKTGRTDRWRAILFTVFAVAFVISFISHYVEARGSMALSESEILECRTPFCHIVIPMTIIPLALTRTIIFPGTMTGVYAAIASMFIIWIGASLSLGRGFCAWGCFLGGWDDGFSRIMKRPIIKNIGKKWHYLSFAVLLVVALTSAAMLSPTYCEWLCPYKAVTEYVQVTSLTRLVQMIIFLTLFAGLVIVLPIFTKRRVQCGLFCPFGAFQSFTNKISPFEVRVDKDLCVNCRKCITVCPTFSMSEESLDKGNARMTCIKCGKCIDNCPKRALSFHIRGTSPGDDRTAQRLLFLYPAFLFLSTMAGGNIQNAVVRIIGLFTTGSLLTH